jgi:hypothetical protein
LPGFVFKLLLIGAYLPALLGILKFIAGHFDRPTDG